MPEQPPLRPSHGSDGTQAAYALHRSPQSGGAYTHDGYGVCTQWTHGRHVSTQYVDMAVHEGDGPSS